MQELAALIANTVETEDSASCLVSYLIWKYLGFVDKPDILFLFLESKSARLT